MISKKIIYLSVLPCVLLTSLNAAQKEKVIIEGILDNNNEIRKLKTDFKEITDKVETLIQKKLIVQKDKRVNNLIKTIELQTNQNKILNKKIKKLEEAVSSNVSKTELKKIEEEMESSKTKLNKQNIELEKTKTKLNKQNVKKIKLSSYKTKTDHLKINDKVFVLTWGDFSYNKDGLKENFLVAGEKAIIQKGFLNIKGKKYLNTNKGYFLENQLEKIKPQKIMVLKNSVIRTLPSLTEGEVVDKILKEKELEGIGRIGEWFVLNNNTFIHNSRVKKEL